MNSKPNYHQTQKNIKDKKKLNKNGLPKPRENKILIVMGNGPSLKYSDFNLLKKFDTFGLNEAYRIYEQINFTPTFFGSFDYTICDSHKDKYKEMILDDKTKISKFYFVNYDFEKKEPIFNDKNIVENNKFQKLNFNYRHMEKEKNSSFNENIYVPTTFEKFIDMGNSEANAAQVGMILGYNKIILLGCDYNYMEIVDDTLYNKKSIMGKTPDKNTNYWFNDYQKKTDVYYLHQHSIWQWKYLYEVSKRMNVEIVNCSDMSDIPYFRFSTLEREVLPPLSIIGVHHKCGTILMSQFLKACESGIMKKIYIGEQSGLDEYNTDIWLEKKSKIDLSILKRKYRLVHVIRNPKEIICSSYYHHLKPCIEEWCVKNIYSYGNVKLNTTYQKHLQSLDFTSGLQFEMRESSYRQVRDIYNFMNANPAHCMNLQLETIMNDFDETFKKIMIFFEMRPWMIEKMIPIMKRHNINHPDNTDTTSRCKYIYGDKFDESKWGKISTSDLEMYFNNKYSEFVSAFLPYYPELLNDESDDIEVVNSITPTVKQKPLVLRNDPVPMERL